MTTSPARSSRSLLRKRICSACILGNILPLYRRKCRIWPSAWAAMTRPVFPGIYEASRLLAGGSIDAARRIIAEDCSAFNIGGGLHHAMPSLASGFCVFDDPALAISVLKETL